VSQDAYELLLRANELYESGNKAAAVQMYRAVLQSNPTSAQRQVAEGQLRELGEMPNTFHSSGRVLRKTQTVEVQNNQRTVRKRRAGGQRAGGQRRQHTQEHRSSPPDVGRRTYVPVNRSEPRSSNSNRSTQAGQSRGSKMASLDLSQQIANLPEPSQFASFPTHPSEEETIEAPVFVNTERVIKPRILNPVTAVTYSPYQPPEYEKEFMQAELFYPALDRLFRQARQDLPPEKLETLWEEERGRRPFRLKESLDWLLQKPPSENDEPREPKPKADESEDEFKHRLWRFENWKKYREKYPTIDINIAEQLEELGLSYKEFKNQQSRKSKVRRKRKRRHMRELKQENMTLPGTSYLDEWIDSEQVLWFWGAKKLDLRGRLIGQDVFYLQIRPYMSKVKRFHKTDIQMIAFKKARKDILSKARLPGEYDDTPVHKDPYQRPRLSDEDLLWSLENEEEIFLHFHCNLWLPVRVVWFDPFQLAVEVEGEDEEVELFVFRHALLGTSRDEPEGWEDWSPYRVFE
jgi:hypothetical protein